MGRGETVPRACWGHWDRQGVLRAWKMLAVTTFTSTGSPFPASEATEPRHGEEGRVSSSLATIWQLA